MSMRQRWVRVVKWTAGAVGALLVLTLIVPNVLEKYSSTGSDGGLHRCRTDLRAITAALDEYAARNQGRYPEQLDDLIAPDATGYRLLNYTRIPLDPWRSSYVYVRPASSDARALLYSLVPDRRWGTDDDLRLDDER